MASTSPVIQVCVFPVTPLSSLSPGPFDSFLKMSFTSVPFVPFLGHSRDLAHDGQHRWASSPVSQSWLHLIPSDITIWQIFISDGFHQFCLWEPLSWYGIHILLELRQNSDTLTLLRNNHSALTGSITLFLSLTSGFLCRLLFLNRVLKEFS